MANHNGNPARNADLRGERGLHVVRLAGVLERVETRVAIALEPQELDDLEQLRRNHRYAQLEQSVAETDRSEQATSLHAGRRVGTAHIRRVASQVWNARCVRRHRPATRRRHHTVVEFPIVHVSDDLVGVFIDFPRLAKDPAALDVTCEVMAHEGEDCAVQKRVGRDDLAVQFVYSVGLVLKRWDAESWRGKFESVA